MATFTQIKNWYPDRWKKSWVEDACSKGTITPDEYEEIVGEPYEGNGVSYTFNGLTVADVLRSLNKKATLDELRQACDWLNIPWDRTMTRAQLRALIEAAAEAE